MFRSLGERSCFRVVRNFKLLRYLVLPVGLDSFALQRQFIAE